MMPASRIAFAAEIISLYVAGTLSTPACLRMSVRENKCWELAMKATAMILSSMVIIRFFGKFDPYLSTRSLRGRTKPSFIS